LFNTNTTIVDIHMTVYFAVLIRLIPIHTNLKPVTTALDVDIKVSTCKQCCQLSALQSVSLFTINVPYALTANIRHHYKCLSFLYGVAVR